MLTIHRQGLAAERLAELVYGAPAVGTLRPEMVRLRRRLLAEAPGIDLESRPYRLTGEIETDVQHVIALIDRGAHRLALAAFRGDVLPDSTSPGVEEVRDTVRATLRDAILTEAGLDVLLAYIDATSAPRTRRRSASASRCCRRARHVAPASWRGSSASRASPERRRVGSAVQSSDVPQPSPAPVQLRATCVDVAWRRSRTPVARPVGTGDPRGHPVEQTCSRRRQQ